MVRLSVWMMLALALPVVLALAEDPVQPTTIPATQASTKPATQPAHLQALADAAKQVMVDLEARAAIDGFRPEIIRARVEWSRTLAKADYRVAQSKEARESALQSHVDRLKTLEKVTCDRKGMDAGPMCQHVVTYFRIEAESWLSEGQPAATE